MTNETFERIEKKFRLDQARYERFIDMIEPYMQLDRFGEHTVISLYYDNETYDLIRESIDRPVYKEKLRVRSYGTPGEQDEVFLELKKKYEGIVYKRREAMPLADARSFLAGAWKPEKESQILKEIDYFIGMYRPVPKMMIACERTAYYERFGAELRITVDRNIRFRETELDLSLGSEGTPVCDRPFYILEVKVPGAFPLWLVHVLTELGVFTQPFSKYGTAYKIKISGGEYELI